MVNVVIASRVEICEEPEPGATATSSQLLSQLLFGKTMTKLQEAAYLVSKAAQSKHHRQILFDTASIRDLKCRISTSWSPGRARLKNANNS
jgi:hypothetical protein